MKLVQRGRVRPERSNRIRRSRGAWSPMGPAASVSAGRRSIALALASSIARAGEIGESDPLPRHPPAGTPASGAASCRHARAQPVPLERLRQDSAARNGSFAKSRLLRVAFRYPSRALHSLAGRRRSSLSLSPSSDGVHGVLRPFAGLLPLSGWTRHACFAWRAGAHRCARRFDISAGPGPRAVRASASAPIDFRRGDRSPVGVTRSAKAIGRGCEWLRLLGFVSRLRSLAPAHVWPAR
jgi:hypothetical protein